MRNLVWSLIIASMPALGQDSAAVEFRHLFTFGSKEGIHPPTVLNRRTATVPLGSAANPYGLVYPVGVVTDLRRRVWISDSGTGSVHIFDRARGTYHEIRHVGDIPLHQPSGLAMDAQGRIFLADAGSGGVFAFDEEGEFDRVVARPREHLLESPTAIAISADGKTIYVADPPKNVVLELNREGEVNATIHLPRELGDPSAISVVNNQIYVLGKSQHRVAVFSPGGKARGEVHWDGIQAPSAFTYEAGRGMFLVADPRWMIVEIFNEEGRNLGALGHRGDAVDQMQHVDALHVDAEGFLYLVDSPHGKVLVFGDSRRVL
jgi:DNA-binding beta-propeller fold protein YncE